MNRRAFFQRVVLAHSVRVGVVAGVMGIETPVTTETKRQEAVDATCRLLQEQPSLMDLLGDLLVENMGGPSATKIADRLARLQS